ncbi:MAG: DUF4136 domain-containing protein [Woeseiaceae bacterium]|nr:DUF4136 domain-containing protein [Woeseiaceae bacterium]
MDSARRLTGLLVFALFLNGCATSPTVFTDHDPEQSFDDYKVFAWVGENPMINTGDRPVSPLNASRLQSAIKSELERKGYTYTEDAEQADFAVSFTVGARDKMDVREREVLDYYGPNWRWGYPYHYGMVAPIVVPRTEVTVREYVEGSLAIDIFDVKRRSPVWHADASKRLNSRDLKENTTEKINEAVAMILSTFPPQ